MPDMGNDTSKPWESKTLEEQPLEQNLSAASMDPVIPAAEPCTRINLEGSSSSPSIFSSSSSSSSLSTDSGQKSMSDTDKGDGGDSVICLDSQEDGTPTKKKETVKQKKLKDSASKPEQKTADNKTAAGLGREIHSVTRRVASLQKWPDAPSNMCELMTGWPAYNAQTLPLPSEDVLQMKILVNEAYSGTGNGAVSLHQQWRSLTSEARKRYGLGPGPGPGRQMIGNVITETACDIEPMCREVLQALPEDHGTTVLVGGC